MTTKSSTIQFDTALNKYYKLKHDYDLSIKKIVNKITGSTDLTIKEKQEKFSNFKKRCISCGKSGGTIFKQEGDNLIAECGNTDKPCKLNINLQRAKYNSINSEILKLDKETNNKKSEIIQTKLNFLFGFTPEPKTIEIFNKLKSELINEVKKYQIINEQYINVTQNLTKQNEIKNLNAIFLGSIQNFKNLIKQFDETGELQYLKDAGKLYIDQIIKISNDIQKEKYSIQYIYSGPKDTHHLIQKTYKQSDLQSIVSGTENKIIAFII